MEILLLFGCIHNDRLSKSRSGISFISYKDLHLRDWIKNVQREYENIISYLPLLASSPKTLISCIINGKLQSVVASSRHTRWLLHFVLVKYYSIFVKFQVSIFYFTYHLKWFFVCYINCDCVALLHYVCLCLFLLCVIATLTLCNHVVTYRLQMMLIYCKEHDCLVFLAPWLFKTASTKNYY